LPSKILAKSVTTVFLHSLVIKIASLTAVYEGFRRS
jgi:hypothetical protein